MVFIYLFIYWRKAVVFRTKQGILVHFMKVILNWDFHGFIEFLKKLSHKLYQMIPNQLISSYACVLLTHEFTHHGIVYVTYTVI